MSGIISSIRFVGNRLPEETDPMEWRDESEYDYFDCRLRSSRSEDGIMYLEFSDEQPLTTVAEPVFEEGVVRTYVESADDSTTDEEQAGLHQYFELKLEENPEDVDWELEVVNTVARDQGGKEHKYIFSSS